MNKKPVLLTTLIVSALVVPSAFADQADKVFPINNHIQIARIFKTNSPNHRDNQNASIFSTSQNIQSDYKPCANRVRLEQPLTEVKFVEDAREAYGANQYLWIAHNPDGPVIGDSV